MKTETIVLNEERDVTLTTYIQPVGGRFDKLSGIGILKDELEQAGELETLLRGEKTGVVSLSLVLLGVDVVMDATLQLVRKNDSPLLEIIGINPTQ